MVLYLFCCCFEGRKLSLLRTRPKFCFPIVSNDPTVAILVDSSFCFAISYHFGPLMPEKTAEPLLSRVGVQKWLEILCRDD